MLYSLLTVSEVSPVAGHQCNTKVQMLDPAVKVPYVEALTSDGAKCKLPINVISGPLNSITVQQQLQHTVAV